MNTDIAEMKLMVLESETKAMTWLDLVVILTNNGIPPEITMRLKEIWETTKNIGKQIFHIGKIIVTKIIEFVQANPNMAIGLVIGVAIGSLTSAIPWIGPILAPLTMVIGGFAGAISGHRLDKIAKGQMSEERGSDFFADLITMAKEFWRGIVEIFQALNEHLRN